MAYLKLFLGRQWPEVRMEDEARPGPIFGPFPSFYGITGRELRFDNDKAVLTLVDNLVYYDGMFYPDWSVFCVPPDEADRRRLTTFDPDKAVVPEDALPCACMEPGDFHCGVPGILAHLQDGRVAPEFDVERCDACRRFESDAAAEARLRELGLFTDDDPRSRPPEERRRTYSVHCYATVRVKLPDIVALDEREAARKAGERFDWDRYQAEARSTPTKSPGFWWTSTVTKTSVAPSGSRPACSKSRYDDQHVGQSDQRMCLR